MVKREIYSVGLKRKVEAEVTNVIVSPTKGGGQRYQVVGIFEEGGKQHKCQSMIGAAAAEELAATLGITLNQPVEEVLVEETVVMSAEEDTSVEVLEPIEVEPAEVVDEPAATATEPTLLVPEPSTYPTGDGRAIGAHTGLNIAADVGGDMSLPPTDYVWIGRAEAEGDEGDFDYNLSEETFLVHTSLKNYIAEEFWEEIMEGLLQVRTGPIEDEWIITFAPWLMEDIVSSISDFQNMDVEVQQIYLNDPDDDSKYGVDYDFDWGNDADLADWVRAEEFNARGFVDMDDMIDDESGNWRAAAAVGAALLAIGASYWWANKK